MENQEHKKAVALRYDMEKDEVPVVVAKGRGVIAENIARLAEQNQVPLRQDKQLADYLMALELYQEIPPELYGVVAEILAFIYRMDQGYKKGLA
ncbi:MAG: EscU/YscU/HrcU family type III secretion system export apparatus switch protein [Syntrophomonas sp.]